MSKITYTDKQFLYENAPIPATQKVEDTDLNNIKGAINQNGAYTPTTFSNNQYLCTLTGTLSTGDVIQVQLDLSNQNAGTDSDISISVDGGSTYYNLLDKTGSYNLMASDFDFSNIYLKAVFNGSEFVLLSPDKTKNYIELGLNEEQTYSRGINYYYVSQLNNIIYQKGNKFTIGIQTPSGSSSAIEGVKIPANISKVKVSGMLYLQNNNSSSAMYMISYIYKVSSDGQTSTSISAFLQPNIPAQDYNSFALIPQEIEVNEGDIIGFRVYIEIARGSVNVLPTQGRTYLVVEEVE